MVGILTHEALDAGPPCHAARSVLAAPLVAFDKLIGAIVLEADGPAERFDEGHLRLMMAIAGMAQMTWHARPSLLNLSESTGEAESQAQHLTSEGVMPRIRDYFFVGFSLSFVMARFSSVLAL